MNVYDKRNINKQPTCAAPEPCALSVPGWYLCSNPAHRTDPSHAEHGPFWHPTEERPSCPS